VDADSSESVTKRLLNQEDFEEGIVGSGEKNATGAETGRPSCGF